MALASPISPVTPATAARSWNPLKFRGTELPTELLILVKVLALVVLLRTASGSCRIPGCRLCPACPDRERHLRTVGPVPQKVKLCGPRRPQRNFFEQENPRLGLAGGVQGPHHSL